MGGVRSAARAGSGRRGTVPGLMAVEVRYTKSQVVRAGKLLRDLRTAFDRDGQKAFRAFDAEVVADAFLLVEAWRGRHARPLARVNAGLRYYVKKAGAEPQVTQRLKRFSTIVHKLQREPRMALTSMEDIGGVRAILPTQGQVLDVVAMLDKADRWKIRRQRFYVDGGRPGPKRDGYRAVHLVVVKDGCYIEIQLRTPSQDAWAQSVEQDTRRLRQDLKFGSGPDDLREYYSVISEYFAMIEASIEPEQEFMEDLAKLYAATRRYFPADRA
jgi:ppGpp synthetase/RelA/SpoT-type nucleotidyltranferase